MNFQNEDLREDEMREKDQKISKTGILAAGGILAAALLIGGISLFASCSNKDKENAEANSSVSGNGTGKNLESNVISREMLQEELKTISEQLTKLDKEVINNQSILEKVMTEGTAGSDGADGSDGTDGDGVILNGQFGLTEEYVTLVTRELSSMRNVYQELLAKVENHERLFTTYLENYVEVTGGNQSAIVDLQTSLTKTKEMISVSNQNITDTLEMLKNEQNIHQSELLKQFSEVKTSITETENLILEAQKGISDALDGMDETLQENHSELVENMTSMQESFERAQEEELEIIQESFTQLNTYLDAALTSQTEAITTQMETVYDQLQEQIDGVSQILTKSEETLNHFYEEYQADTQEQAEALRLLDTSVTEAKQQLAEAAQELTDTLAQMEANDEQRQEVLGQKLDIVNDTVETVREQLSEVEQNISGMLDSMSEQQKADHAEVIGTLETVQNNLQESLDKGFSETSEKLDAIHAALNANAAQMEQNFSDLDESMRVIAAEKTAEMKTQMADMLTVIQGDFAHVDEQLSDAKELFDAFQTEYREDIDSTGLKLDQIEGAIAAASEQASTAEQKIKDTLMEMEANDETRQEELTASLEEIQNAIMTAQNQILEVSGAINETLGQMSEQQKADHQELTDALTAMETAITEGMEYHFTVMGQDLSAMQEKMEVEFVVMQETFGEGVNVLQGQMTDIHSQIAATQDEIKEILTAMDEKSDMQYEEVMEAIEDAVDQINSDMNSAHNNLQGLIRILTADVAMNHRDTLDTLEEMESSMSGTLADNMAQISDSFGNLTLTLEEQFKQVQENQNQAQDELDTVVEELGTDLTENQQIIMDQLTAHDQKNTNGQENILGAISEHDSSVSHDHDTIQGQITEHNTGIISMLEAFKADISDKLNSVFQFVSNGKKKLASALLTKGVSVNEDATFTEIYEGIMNIPQEIVLGVQQIPGEIAYDYHYHVDGNGNQVNAESHSVSGGCFTAPVYHSHSNSCYSSAKCGGSVTRKTSSTHWKCSDTLYCDTHGCYWEDPNETYPSGCWHCYCPEETYTECNSCGATNSGSPCGRTVTKQTCGKSTSTVDSYKAGCGLLNGQIIAAHIVYDQAAVSAASVMSLSLEDEVTEFEMEEYETESEQDQYFQIELPEGAVIDRGEVEAETEVDNAVEMETKTDNVAETESEIDNTAEMETVEEQEKESEATTEAAVEAKTEDAVETEAGEETEASTEPETALAAESVIEEIIGPETDETISEEAESTDTGNNETVSSYE